MSELLVTFRFATDDDNVFFHNQFLKEEKNAVFKLGYFGFDEDNFAKSMHGVAFVATVNKKIVGFVKAQGAEITGFNYIGEVYVIPEMRHRGIGREMLTFIQDYIHSNWNAVGVHLFTIENKKMEKLVTSLGFKISGVTKKHYFHDGKFFSQTRWIKLYK